MDLNAYLPMDRVSALAQGIPLSKHTQGTVLFADISGFTPLTEALTRRFGTRRGAEELSHHLNVVYDLLVNEVHRYRGSVIGFSGDAITCWFDGDPVEVSARAVQCALAMQGAIATCATISVSEDELVTIAIKVALATGKASRFLVGDSSIRHIEVLAGDPINRVARAETIAKRGEIIADETAIELSSAVVSEWRTLQPDKDHQQSDGVSGQTLDKPVERFAIVTKLDKPVGTLPWESYPALAESVTSAWMIPSVYTRMKEGLGDFVTELRPAIPMFLQFNGIDYDADPNAQQKLDDFIRHVQHTLHYFDGTLIQLTIGDKGSYLYVAFGVPIAQEDAVERATLAALELSKPFADLQIRIGISQGIVRTGTYGSSMRRDYGVLGSEVNLAARLMQLAQPFQVIASKAVYKNGDVFDWQMLPPVKVKGVDKPIPVARLMGKRAAVSATSSVIRTLVGRVKEQSVLMEQLRLLETRQQESIVVVEGDAGMGKSTLINALVGQVESTNVTTLVGAGDAIEKRPYFAWNTIFISLLGEVAGSYEQWQSHILAQVKLDTDYVELLPLLNSVLPTNFPENSLTTQLTGEGRAYNTERLLAAILHEAAQKKPILLILEDVHWLDSPSWSLLRAVKEQVHPVLMVLATRPMSDNMPPAYKYLISLPDAVHLPLKTLATEEISTMIAQRLQVNVVPEPVHDLIVKKSEGHPFFCEELVYALRDNGLITTENNVCRIVGSAESFQNLNLPDTVEGVVASRIDKLQPSQQLAVKVASVIGRQFSHRLLSDVYPLTTEQRRLLEHLGVLERVELIAQEVPEPQLVYLFRHIITVEVAYNLLLFSQRRDLHRMIAEWYEYENAAHLAPHYALLAYHWNRAGVTQKKAEYLEKAGIQALATAAYAEAIEYFTQLLTMVEQSEFQTSTIHLAELELHLGEAYHGLFLLTDAETHYERAFSLVGFPVPNSKGKLALHLLGHAVRQFWNQLWHRIVPARQLSQNSLAYERFRISTQASMGVGPVYYMLNKPLTMIYSQFNSANRGEQIKQSPSLGEIYAGIGMTLRFVGLNKLSDYYGELGTSIVNKYNDMASQAWAKELIYVGNVQVGRFANAAEHFEHSANVFKRLGNIRRFHENKFYLGITYYLQGEYAKSFEALNIQVSRVDLVIRASVNTFKAQALMQLGELDKSITLLREGISMIADLKSFKFIAIYGVLGQIYLRQNKYDLAEEMARIAAPGMKDGWMLQYEGMTSVIDIFMTLWEMAASDGRNDDNDYQYQANIALAYLVKFARLNRFCKARVKLYQGWVAWLTNKPRRAFVAWKQSLAIAQKRGLRLDEARSLYEIGRHLPLNDLDRANYLGRSHNMFTQLNTPYYLSLVASELGHEINENYL